MIIGMAFCFFEPVSSFPYPLKLCSNNNDNDPSGSLLGSSLKAALKDWYRYPMVSLTVVATSLFFCPCKNSACLTACVKATKTSCLCQRLNTSRKTLLLSLIDCGTYIIYSKRESAWLCFCPHLRWIGKWLQHQAYKSVDHDGELWQLKIGVRLGSEKMSE